MKKKLPGIFGAAVLTAALLGACASPSTAEAEAVGSWGSDEPGQPQLTLERGGGLHGTDGCNRMSGSWEIVEGHISLGPIASTRMACQGVDTWLSGVASLKVAGDVLRVFDGDGNEIGTLPRR